jgi:hypothetical protein
MHAAEVQVFEVQVFEVQVIGMRGSSAGDSS